MLMLTQAPVRWINLDVVDSTNAYLLKNITPSFLNEVVVVHAREQTAGRGRQGRAWLSKVGSSLCFSVGLALNVIQMPYLPLLVGVAVANALKDLGIPAQLKWPNDLLLDGQKVGGILCESISYERQTYVVIGIGLNLNGIEQVDALGGAGAANLAQACGVQSLPNAQELLRVLVKSLLTCLEEAQTQGFAACHARFQSLDAWQGREVYVLDSGHVVHEGRALGVSEKGSYLIQTPTGIAEVWVGDVSLRVRNQ